MIGTRHPLVRLGLATIASGLGTLLCWATVAALNRLPPPPSVAQPLPASIEIEPPSEPPPPPPDESIETIDPALVASASASTLTPTPQPSALPSAGSVPGLPGLRSELGSGWGIALPSPTLPGPPATPSVPTVGTTRAARPLHRPTPTYPHAAQRLGTEGYVTVRMRVDARGHVTDVVVIDAQPAGVFEQVAKATARRYRFEPALEAGEPVESTIEQRIVFRLKR